MYYNELWESVGLILFIYFDLFIHGLFNYAVNDSKYTLSNDKMISE